jgi:sec-independent protein translocase protein TatB
VAPVAHGVDLESSAIPLGPALRRLRAVFNVSGGELVVILLVALIVLGPDKLPEAIRKFGRVYGELRRMSQGFQSEIRDALDEPMREVRDTMNTVTGGFTGGADPPPGTRLQGTTPEPVTDDGGIALTPDTERPPNAEADAGGALSGPEPARIPDGAVPAPDPMPEPVDDFEPFPAVPTPPEALLTAGPDGAEAPLAGRTQARNGSTNGHGPAGDETWPSETERS